VAGTGALCNAANNTGWCWQDTVGAGNPVAAVSFVDAPHGWAAGAAGFLMRSDDAGSTWSLLPSGVADDFVDVRFIDANTGWAAAADGAVLRTTDGGTTWATSAIAASSDLVAIVPLDATTLRVVDGQGLSHVSVDGGASFGGVALAVAASTASTGDCWSVGTSVQRLPRCGQGAPVDLTPVPGAQYFGIASDDGTNLLVRGHDPLVDSDASWSSADGGAHWSEVVNADLGPGDVEFFDGEQGWSQAAPAGGAPVFFHTAAAGTSWKKVDYPAPFVTDKNVPMNAGTLDPVSLWISQAGVLAITRNGGLSWIESAAPFETAPADAVALAGADVVARFGSRVYRSTDSGRTWSRIVGPNGVVAGDAVASLWLFDASNGFAMLQSGATLRTADGGANWYRSAEAGGPKPRGDSDSMQFVSSTAGWAILDLHLAQTTDGGATWIEAVSTLAWGAVDGFDFVDPTHGWALTNGEVMATSDGGTSWTQVGLVPPDGCKNDCHLRMRDTQVGLLAMGNGMILRTADGGTTWTQVTTVAAPALVRALRWSDTGVAWAVGDQVALRSPDAGVTWAGVSLGTPGAWSDVAFPDPAHGWLVGLDGVLLATTDGGQTWQHQDALLGRGLTSAFFVDASTGWIGSADGLVLATTTGGG
jgi:photosystem II stability/assembly factor-like uncharacterized protein